MKKIIKVIIYLIINIIPIIIFVAFGCNSIATIFIVLYSVISIILHIITVVVERFQQFKYFSLPVGCIVVSFAVGYNVAICSDISLYIIVLAFFSLLPFAVYGFMTKKKQSIVQFAVSILCTFLVFVGQFLYVNDLIETGETLTIEAEITEKYANGDWFKGVSSSKFEVFTNDYGYIRISVSEDTYNKYYVNDVIVLNIKQGFFGIEYCCSL